MGVRDKWSSECGEGTRSRCSYYDILSLNYESVSGKEMAFQAGYVGRIELGDELTHCRTEVCNIQHSEERHRLAGPDPVRTQLADAAEWRTLKTGVEGRCRYQ